MAVFGPFAFVEAPSFHGIPWIGLLLLGLYALTAAAAMLAATRAPQVAGDVAVPRAETWGRWFMLLPLALLFGPIVSGPIAVPLAAAAVGASGLLFLRLHDARARSGHRLLSRRGLSRALEQLKRRRPGQTKRTKPGPKSVREWMKSFSGGEGRLSAELLVQPTSTVASDATLTLVRKDGTPVSTGGDEGGGESDNVRHAREILVAAMQAEATDIHVEPHEQEYVIRYRIDGVLEDTGRLDQGAGRGLLSALKVAADMNIAERRRPQDGTFCARLDETAFDVRVACAPTSDGEKMVLRLLQSSGGMLATGLDSIGLRSSVLKQVREVIHKPHGMLLVVGPPGSGKTTTVYAALGEIDAQQNTITTIEDPVEYRLDHTTQIAVDEKSGVTFASILRSVLRQDSDVLLVGEIRDKETAEIACQAALTGHFVFSTLQAHDTVATVTRLLELGLDPSLIQTAVTAVLGQRLARKLCTECREPVPPPAGLEKRFNLAATGVKHIYRERGCEHCRGTGYRGRVGIHELLVMTDEIRRLITAQPTIDDVRQAAARGGTKSMQTDGLMKVCKGITSINEIIRVTT
jgi:type II secretory ATPase GspE/PulE/Tfp pilus assembly ATPase PilB-like protein